MKGRYIHMYILAALMICGCVKNIETPAGECDIMLKASVSNVQVSTKTKAVNAYEGSVPSEKHILETDLWFSLNSGDYSTAVPTDELTNVPCHTYATFNSGDITPIFYNDNNTQPLKYPTSGAPVYCVGLYPKGVWEFANGRFEADVTGEQDLMLAPEISGQWNAQFGTNETNSPKFNHVLTWLKVVLCATSYAAIENWGEITDVTVKGLPTRIFAQKDGSVTFGNTTQDIMLIPDGKSYPLSITNIDLGAITCAPADSYTFTIETADGMKAQKTMSIDGGFKAGYQYVMVLYFDSLTVIDGVCTLVPWENQNDNLYLN
ncbi:MAG: fimbrillin family protein [Bacteroidales bacterium]|nr:fimbrillin family protein [Bacteroidales bacterium]